MLAVVQTEFRYRGRNISGAEIESVRQLIADHPGLSRRRLSAKLCQSWNWVQANGQLRDMVARSLMLQLHRAGLIVLPAKRKSVPNNAARHRAPLLEPSLEVAPLECDLAELGPLEIRQVRRTPEEALFGRLLQTYHYLGYRRPVGEHVKYLVYGRGQPIACLAWSSAPRHLGPRDRFIGWSAPQRRAQIHLLAYNTRFLILALGASPALGQPFVGPGGAPDLGRLAAALPASDLFAGDLHRAGPLSRHLLSRGQLASPGLDHGPGQGRSDPPAQPLAQGTLGPAPGAGLSPTALPGRP